MLQDSVLLMERAHPELADAIKRAVEETLSKDLAAAEQATPHGGPTIKEEPADEDDQQRIHQLLRRAQRRMQQKEGKIQKAIAYNQQLATAITD